MVGHYFKWNGTDSRTKHIRVPNRIPIIRPEERVQRITIPGRSGELTETEGENVYNSYIQTIEISVDGLANVHDVETWLKGEGQVVFDNQPQRSQKARIQGVVTLEKHSRNVDKWKGTVQFYCDPIKKDTAESNITITSSGTTVNNPGDMTAYPLIAITGSGAITISAGGNTLTIPDCTSGWVVDSENEWILSGTTPQGNVCSGNFPVLKPGSNTIAFTGSITSLVITPRFRYM